MGFNRNDPFNFDRFEEVKPDICQKCGGDMKFAGLGEYKCDRCGALEYDDFGKVRLFLEKYPGATAYEVSRNTGVSRRQITRMIEEGRITH